MIKKLPLLALLSSTLFYASSGYEVQKFVDEVSRASGIFTGKAINIVEDGQDLSVTIGEYEWMVTDDDNGELKFSVDRISANNEELISALDEFYTSFGESLQNNDDEIEDALEGALEAIGVLQVFQIQQITLANMVRQTGIDFQTNSSTYSAEWLKEYMEADANLAKKTHYIDEFLNNELQDIHDFDSALVALDIDESLAENLILMEPAFDDVIASIDFEEADVAFQDGYKVGHAASAISLGKHKL